LLQTLDDKGCNLVVILDHQNAHDIAHIGTALSAGKQNGNKNSPASAEAKAGEMI
jgi:hypothetical protein